MIKQVEVRFTKVFTKGILKGISIECVLPVASKDSAKEYLNFCKAHETKPVDSVVGSGSSYLIKNPIVLEY